MSFDSPLLLVSLVLVPLAAAGYVWRQRQAPRYAVRFPNLEVLASVAERGSAWRGHAVAALLLTSLAVLCVALARPMVTVAAPQEQAAVVLLVDVSGSMRAEDVEPTRLGAAQAAIEAFLAVVPKELRVAVVAFSEQAEVVAPPVRDRELLRESLDLLMPQRGTAIGDALERAVELGRSATSDPDEPADDTLAPDPPPDPASGDPGASGDDGEAPPATILMLSDGFQTRGLLLPEEGAELAREQGFPVYTIALGTDEGTIVVERFGERQEIPVPPDRETLRRVAESTGGEYYDAPDAEQLRAVYERLGSRIGRDDEPREMTAWLVGGAAAALGLAGIAALGWRPWLP